LLLKLHGVVSGCVVIPNNTTRPAEATQPRQNREKKQKTNKQPPQQKYEYNIVQNIAHQHKTTKGIYNITSKTLTIVARQHVAFDITNNTHVVSSVTPVDQASEHTVYLHSPHFPLHQFETPYIVE
jgi:hypothetical protein